MAVIVIRIVTILAFVTSWSVSRGGRRGIGITDAFAVTLLLIYAPSYLVNPSTAGVSTAFPFATRTLFEAELGMTLMWLIISIVFIVPLPIRSQATDSASSSDRRIGIAIGVCGSMLLFGLLLASPDFRAFRASTLRFLTGGLSVQDYVSARRIEFADSLVVTSILGRLRFTILPVLFLLGPGTAIVERRYIMGLLGALAFFVLLPLSLAKLPFVYYGAYILVFFAVARGLADRLRLREILGVAALSLVAACVILALLYTVQYKGVPGFEKPWGQPLQLSVTRIWGENHSAVLRYFEVYPRRLPHTGVSSIGLLADLLHIPRRNTDIEVPQAFFGSQVLTTNPGVFALSGYASFGYVGIALYTLLVASFVRTLDYLRQFIRNGLVGLVYTSLLLVNVTFFAQIAAPTVLLTYGMGVLPVLFILTDVYIRGRHFELTVPVDPGFKRPTARGI